jgi:hypothetical protein
MASSSKTAFLGLSNWAASDKPKRDDFNEDNRLIDSGMQMLSQNLDSLSALSESISGAVSGLLDCEFGSYDGNSAEMRRITLGYAPKFVFVFPVNRALHEVTFTSGALYVYSAAGIGEKASKGLMLESDGFTVIYNVTVNAGVSMRTNQSGITYCYLACK